MLISELIKNLESIQKEIGNDSVYTLAPETDYPDETFNDRLYELSEVSFTIDDDLGCIIILD